MSETRDVRELHNAAAAAQAAADYLTLAQLAHQMIEISEKNGDTLGLAWGHYFVGASNYQRNDGPAAKREYRAAKELFEQIENREGVARSMLGMAAVAIDVDVDVAEGRHLYDLAVPIIRQLGDKRRLGIVLGNLGEICRLEGSVDKALQYAREAVEVFRGVGDHASVGWQLCNIAQYQLLQRDDAGAVESMREAYAELSQDPIPRWVAWYFDTWFMISASRDRWEVAAQIYAFTNRYRDENSAPRYQGVLPWFSGPVEQLSQQIEPERLQTLFDAGESLTIETAEVLAAS